MEEKTLHILEYPKILERLANYCAFDASAEMARNLRPLWDHLEILRLQAETREALLLQVKHSDLTIGGARDVRASVDLANHGGVLTPQELLDIKYTLVAGRNLKKSFERMANLYPHLAAIVEQIPPPSGLIDAITRAISDHGEILDSASQKLETIRRDLRISHDRLMTKLQRMVTDPKNTPYLQEALITQRDGRYVLPLRSEFKGRIRSIVHDQSASGATLFVEPIPVVELNNKFRELQLAERDEERRILAELSQHVAMRAGDLLLTVKVVAELDLALAKGKFADDTRATEPILQIIKPRDGRHPGTLIRLYQARHPLLDPKTVVPIDVDLDPQTYAMIITGPNTGGKTVTLKTIGLLALMAQSGLHIPAHSGSEISMFDNIYADIGDEQSIEQSLSTFSGHITNIIHILEKADRRSLVILDELGAGTDPTEGAALARALLQNLLDRGITTLVTTHHPELKAFAHATSGVVNASVEFDLETLRPTYHLTIGLPGRSNALAIAQRLGMSDEIIDRARGELSPDDVHAEDLLDEIHRQRDLTRQARSAAEKSRQEVEMIQVQLVDRLERIEEERQSVLENARQEAEAQVQALQTELADVRRALIRARQPVEALQPIEDKVNDLEAITQAPIEQITPEVDLGQRRPICTGDKVRLRTLGMQGVVSSISGQDAEVQVGMLRVRVRLSDLELASQKLMGVSQGIAAAEIGSSDTQVKKQPKHNSSTMTSEPPGSKRSRLLPESPGMELDLRGQRADDALDALDRYIDSAYLTGLPFVRIIHGKGTGRLREVVRKALSQNSHVRSIESGGDKEGGEGVTIAKIAN